MWVTGVRAAPPPDSRDVAQRALLVVQRAAETAPPERESAAREALAILESDAELSGNAWLRAPLEERPPNLEAASARLSEAGALVDSPSGRNAPADAHATLVRILNDPPFQTFSWLQALPSWLVPVVLTIGALLELVWRLVRWPFDRLLDLLGLVLGGPAVLVLAIAVVVGVVLLYRWAIRSAIVRQAEVEPPPIESPPTAVEALSLAQRRAGEGRYREACHFVLLSTLLWLEERGRTRFEPSATNREHLNRLAAEPSLAGALRPIVARFDRLWYGQDAVTDADYQDLLSMARRFREVTG
jgi:hypothetical protein